MLTVFSVGKCFVHAAPHCIVMLSPTSRTSIGPLLACAILTSFACVSSQLVPPQKPADGVTGHIAGLCWLLSRPGRRSCSGCRTYFRSSSVSGQPVFCGSILPSLYGA